MFSSSNRNGGFESFGAQGGNPFGQNQGSMTINPFQIESHASVVKTTFGQNLGFNTQSPLPPDGMMGVPGTRFNNQPPLPPGGIAKAPILLSGGTGNASNNANLTDQASNNMTWTHTNANKSFGSTTFDNNVQPYTSSARFNTTFGFASSSNGKSANQGYGGNKSDSFVGSTKDSFDKGFKRGQAAFGASKHGPGTFSCDSSGFEHGNFETPSPLSLPATLFGNQSSGLQVRKKKSFSPTMSFVHVDNPFASTASNDGSTNGQAFLTTFGRGAGETSFSSSSFGKSSMSNDAVTATAFGTNRRQSKPLSNSEALVMTSDMKAASFDARTSSAKKPPLGKAKFAEGFGMGSNEKKFREKRKHGQSYNSSKVPVFEDVHKGSKALASNSTREKYGKRRQSRHQKKEPNTSDEDNPPILMPSAVSSLNDESSKAELSAATNLDGRCADMCSPAERELHIRVDELSIFEKAFPDRPGTERDMIIKRFQRSSADHKLDIPEEIRPPGVLRRTQLYIEQAIMDLDQCGLDPRFQTPRVPEPIELYNFCWDRFRMIRKDFVLQNYRGAGGRVHPIVFDVHERIARYHVLSEHELIETPSFVAQQNMEQLGQTLKSLNELYDESHKIGNPAFLSPFEAECRAYFILCTLDNGRGMDVLKYVKNLPRHIMESEHLKFAMRVFVARHTGDYFQFFLLLRQATYLQSCLLFRYIPNVRSSALLRMNRAYRGQAYPLEDLVVQLCFDDIEHAYSVCQEHQLQLSGRLGAGDDSSIIVKFGGDFETDVQLRRNNTPLQTRSSKIYVGMKQGNYLRRDVCRGVTEYARNEYPALSKLIQDLEREEQARLYPEKAPYVDDYSFFVDYSREPPVQPAMNADANILSSQQPSRGIDQKRVELDVIAEKKKELERKKVAMLERMRELEKAKEEKAQAKTAAEEKRMEASARLQVEKEAKQKQEVIEAQLRKQKKQREVEEQRKKVEEVAREAERQRAADLQRAEALRQKAFAEKRRLEEEKRLEEARQKAAEEREQHRQQELAKARARVAREAALEAQRQAQLAKEQAERKKVRRQEKQRRAILKLRLQLWKKYVRVSRDGPGPVPIASKLRLEQPHQKAKDSMQWLFRGSSGTSIGTKRLKKILEAEEQASFSTAELLSLWHAEDVVALVGPSLRKQNSKVSSIAWKLVIADLLENASSSFGLWCAVRAGTQDVLTPERDCHRAYYSSNDMAQGIAVCCRYLDSTFTRRNTHERQQDKLAATSAILLPVDLSTLQQADNVTSWEEQVGELLSLLSTGCRVTIVCVGFASAEMKSSRATLLNTLESCIEHVQRRFQAQVAQVSVELVDAGGFLPHKFRQVLQKIAKLSPPVCNFKSVGLKELLEDNVKAVMNQFESSIDIQNSICAVFSRLRQDILSSKVMDFVYPPPELQFAILDSPRGWNSRKRRHEIQIVLTALEVTRILVETSSVDRDRTCDVYFKNLAEFIDRLFQSYTAATPVSTYELKKRIYCALLPIHEQLIQDGKTEQVTPLEADVLLPWRKFFEEIYETFFETLSDITIYDLTDWQSGSSLVNVPLTSTRLESGSSIKRDCPVVKQPVQVPIQSVLKSFGTLRAVNKSVQQYKTVGKMKRLRVEIEKERAATSQFQRMLRQAMNYWDD